MGRASSWCRVTEATLLCPPTNPLWVKGLFRSVCWGALREPTWSAVVAWLGGSGSDFTEEPAVRDGRPATLVFESFPLVLPGPAYLVVRRASVTRRR